MSIFRLPSTILSSPSLILRAMQSPGLLQVDWDSEEPRNQLLMLLRQLVRQLERRLWTPDSERSMFSSRDLVSVVRVQLELLVSLDLRCAQSEMSPQSHTTDAAHARHAVSDQSAG